MYETFEHTADLGLRIRADDLKSLFEEAAEALFSVVVVNLDDVAPVRETRFQLEADRLDELLRDWLAELLFAFHAEHIVFSQFDVTIEDTRLTATARGEPIDPKRHELASEVKAITYHELKVEHDHFGYLAEVIVDV